MRPVVGTLAIALFLVLACAGLFQAWAGWLGFLGSYSMTEWSKGKRNPGPDEWARAQQHLESARTFERGNPKLLEDLARVYKWQVRYDFPTSRVDLAYLQQALDLLRQSARLRPVSARTWSSIAATKSQLALLDDEFLHAIDNAARLGPWEPEVQIALANIGFLHWQGLPKPTQAVLQLVMQRGLKRQDEELFNLATRTLRLDVLCAVPGARRSKFAVRCR